MTGVRALGGSWRRRPTAWAAAGLVAAVGTALVLTLGSAGTGAERPARSALASPSTNPSASPIDGAPGDSPTVQPSSGPAPSCADDSAAGDRAVTPTPGQVLVFFGCAEAGPGGRNIGVGQPRPVDSDSPEDRLEAAFRFLAMGPSAAEAKAGYYSPVPDRLSAPKSVQLSTDGVLTVDYPRADNVQGVESARGSAALYALRSTAFQSAAVKSVVFTMDGDCATFYGLFERACMTLVRGDGTRT